MFATKKSDWHPLLLLFLGLAVIALALINEVAYRRATNNAARRGEVLAVLEETRSLAQAIDDAGSSERLYLLAGDGEHLRLARGAELGANQHLRWLTTHYQRRPFAQLLVTQLTAACQARLALLKHATELRSEGRSADALQLVSTDHSASAVHAALSAVEAAELQRAHSLRDQSNTALVIERFGIDLMALLTLMMLGLLALLSRKRAADQARHEQELQQERDQFEEKVHSRTAELADLTLHLQTAREDERTRIGRELHDELGSLLTAAKIDLEWIRHSGGGSEPYDIAERLHHVGGLLDGSAAVTRRIIEDLRPSALVHLGLAPALENLATDFGNTTGISVATDLAPVQLTESGRITAFRIVQESLTNVARHAHALHVSVSLQSVNDRAVIVVRDDGRGFDASSVRRTSHGLRGMLFRARSEGGGLRVDSRPGAGTRVEAQLPLRTPEAQVPTTQP